MKFFSFFSRSFLVLFSSYPSRLPLSSLPLHRLSLSFSPILGPILGFSHPPSRSFFSSSSSLVASIRFSSFVHRLSLFHQRDAEEHDAALGRRTIRPFICSRQRHTQSASASASAQLASVASNSIASAFASSGRQQLHVD